VQEEDADLLTSQLHAKGAASMPAARCRTSSQAGGGVALFRRAAVRSFRRATTHASILGDTGETRRARPHATTHTALAGLAHRPLTISFNPLPPTRLLLCACTSHLNLS
jgi:hypothetical protein